MFVSYRWWVFDCLWFDCVPAVYCACMLLLCYDVALVWVEWLTFVLFTLFARWFSFGGIYLLLWFVICDCVLVVCERLCLFVFDFMLL